MTPQKNSWSRHYLLPHYVRVYYYNGIMGTDPKFSLVEDPTELRF